MKTRFKGAGGGGGEWLLARYVSRNNFNSGGLKSCTILYSIETG